jgi:hypothetical protein
LEEIGITEESLEDLIITTIEVGEEEVMAVAVGQIILMLIMVQEDRQEIEEDQHHNHHSVAATAATIGGKVEAEEEGKDYQEFLCWYGIYPHTSHHKIFKWHLDGLGMSVMCTFRKTTILIDQRALRLSNMPILTWHERHETK